MEESNFDLFVQYVLPFLIATLSVVVILPALKCLGGNKDENFVEEDHK